MPETAHPTLPSVQECLKANDLNSAALSSWKLVFALKIIPLCLNY